MYLTSKNYKYVKYNYNIIINNNSKEFRYQNSIDIKY